MLKQLGLINVEFYFPQVRVNTKDYKLRKTVPFFPRYIFINVDHNMVIDPKVKWMPGLVSVVSFDGQPAIVSDEIIHQLQKRIEENEIKKNNKISKFKKGDHVTIVEGPFAGYSGIFDKSLSGDDRAKILVKLINDQSRKMVMPCNHIIRESIYRKDK